MFKEQLNGKYDGVTPATLLPPGSVSGGKNMRKVGLGGGWKPRKGVTFHNTTLLGAYSINSLHQYTHPRNADYHFICQLNSLLYDSTTDPPTAGAAFGTSLGIAVGTTPGFSCIVNDHWFYADGSGKVITYGGTLPFCSGFLGHFDIANDGTPDTYVDYTREVTDGSTNTYATLRSDVHDVVYICCPEICDSITLTLGSTVNDIASVLTLKSWQAGAWSDRSATDGTILSENGKSLSVSGAITWVRSTNDTMRVLGGIMGYWYQLTWSVALTAGVTITKCQTTFDTTSVTNKWNGVYQLPTGIRFYDQSVTEYVDYLGKLSTESTSQYAQLEAATTSDYLYIKTNEPATGFGFGVVPEYEQTGNAQVDQIDVWTGVAWTAVTTGIVDETLDEALDSSFAQTGTIWFNAAAVTAKRRVFDWDSLPGYWYRISWDATLVGTSSDLRIFFVTYAPFPEALHTADGCVNFKNRLLTWGDPEYPNRMRYSAAGKPDCFCGSDSGYSDAFGDSSKVLCAIPFYNELMVFKRDSVWLLEGYNPASFGTLKITDSVGLSSPKTAHIVEIGYPGMLTTEPLSVALWQDTDGVYALDGRKPKKISLPVDDYFNQEFSNCIAAASIANRQAFIDKLNNEYHLLLPTSELVYNFLTDEWYPARERNIDLITGLGLRGTDGRFYTYGGDAAGIVHRLENDTTDKTSANADAIITHTIKTRAISLLQKMSTTLSFTFRRVWIEAKARTTPTTKTITTNFYKDLASAATALTSPSAMDLANTGYSLATPRIDASQEDCSCFQLEFSSATADLEMEIWSFLYEIDARGEIGL